jgi:hypothetical protein
MLVCYVYYGFESCEALLDRAVYIFLSESLTCSSEYSYFLHLGCQGSMHVLCIRYKYWVADIGMFLYQPKYF